MDAKFTTYSASDFATDDDFVAYVLQQKNSSSWESWLSANEAKRADVALAKEFVLALSKLPQQNLTPSEKDKLWSRIKTDTSKGEAKKFSLLKFWPIAVAACLALFIYIALPGGTGTYTTVYGEKEEIRLPDQSEMVLNAQSRASWAEKTFKKNRAIKLEGEAFFSVKPGNEFTVSTNEGIVTVLGTSFNVYARDGNLEVKCFSGKVKVTLPNTQETILTQGQKTNIHSATDTLKAIAFTNNAGMPDWIKGSFTFENQPLQFVVEELERQYNIEVDLPSSTKDLKYTGLFELGNLEKALQLITWPLHLQYRIEDKKVYISPK